MLVWYVTTVAITYNNEDTVIENYQVNDNYSFDFSSSISSPLLDKKHNI